MIRTPVIALIILGLGLVNGCSKCSREDVPPLPPPNVEQPGADESVTPNGPTEEMEGPAEGDEDESAPAEDAPAAPNQSPNDNKESVD